MFKDTNIMLGDNMNPFTGLINFSLWICTSSLTSLLLDINMHSIADVAELVKAMITVTATVVTTFVMVITNWNKIVKWFGFFKRK